MGSLDSIVATAIQTMNQTKLLMKQSTQGPAGAQRQRLKTCSAQGLQWEGLTVLIVLIPHLPFRPSARHLGTK